MQVFICSYAFRFAYLFTLLLLLGCNTAQEVQTVIEVPRVIEGKKPKNIIFMVGDGMGLAAVSAAMYTQASTLNLEKFPVIGFHKTFSADNLKTDSAAGATAFACGIKTYNNAIGIYPDSTVCTTILEQAEAKGLSTGIVVTSSLVHATPAAFYGHQPLRALKEALAEDFLQSGIDFAIGGGKSFFDFRDMDERNLIEELRAKNYVVTSFLDDDLGEFTINSNRPFIHFTANADPLPINQGRNYLPYASRLATNYLKKHNSDNGFFLMIEGSQIDWAAHSNLGNVLVAEVLDFDEAIGEVLEFAIKDKETLVIVTADHETGGLAINQKSKLKKLKLEFTTKYHTCTMVPVYAYGPGAELFRGIYDNTAINRKMCSLLDLKPQSATVK